MGVVFRGGGLVSGGLSLMFTSSVPLSPIYVAGTHSIPFQKLKTCLLISLKITVHLSILLQVVQWNGLKQPGG